jgi:hypothetical protein
MVVPSVVIEATGHGSTIPALGRLRQEDLKLKASLNPTVRKYYLWRTLSV